MMWRRHLAGLVLVVAGLASAGCCRVIDMLPQPSEDDGDTPADDDDADDAESPSGSGRADLGNGAFPAGAREDPVAHRWTAKTLSPRKYRIGYQLGAQQAKTLQEDYSGWARKLGHRRTGKNRFQWSPPRRCAGGLHCVYEELAEQDDSAIQPLVERFDKRRSDANLNSMQVASLVITFAQEITYRIPKEQPFGVLPPALVVSKKNGDCDSKSLLAHMLLRRMGIDSVLISSKKHRHTMLGLALPSAGTSFRWQGRRYAFVELTAKRSPIGFIDPKLLRPNDWRVEKMPYDIRRSGGDGASKKRTPAAPKRGRNTIGSPMNSRGGPIRIEH